MYLQAVKGKIHYVGVTKQTKLFLPLRFSFREMDQQVDEILQQEAPIKREEIIKNNSTTGAQVIPKGAKFLANLYLKPVLQRIPGIYTILFLILCFFGPIYTPMLYSIYFAW